jgi:hypothetical protein
MISGAVINVKDYGAVGDGVADDSSAIKAAINAAVASGWDSPKAIYFPMGNYLVTETNVLGQWNSINTSVYKGVKGLTLFGDNKYSSTITLRNAGATDFYFYDNYDGVSAAANNSLQWPRFCDLGFIGDQQSSGVVHGFRCWGESNGFPTQNFNFDNCQLFRINDVLILEGTVNCSENTFNNCSIQEVRKAIYSNNSQAVNHTFLECNVENYFDCVFDFTKGGQLNVIGGSYIGNATPGQADSVVLRVNPPAGTGVGSQFKFIGIKTELKETTNRIVDARGIDNDAQISFDSCSFTTRLGGYASSSIIVGAASHVQLKFSSCKFSGEDGVIWENNGAAGYWITATPGINFFSTLEFVNCINISVNDVVWQSNTLGFTKFYGNGSTPVEMGNFGVFTGNTPATLGLTYKVVQGYGTYWPQGGASPIAYISATVPIGSTIKSILVRKGASGASASSYQLQIQDGGGTPITIPAWATGSNASTIAQQSQEHYIFVGNLMKYVANATAAEIRVAVTSGNEGVSAFQLFHTATENDLFLIEYV